MRTFFRASGTSWLPPCSGGFQTADRLSAIPPIRPPPFFAARVAAGKALSASILSLGLRRLVEASHFAVNAGFSGFSTFGAVPYAKEFEAFLVALGPRPMIMCHPGLPDEELGDRDSIRHRRTEEHQVLATREDIPGLIWRPNRAADATGFPW